MSGTEAAVVPVVDEEMESAAEMEPVARWSEDDLHRALAAAVQQRSAGGGCHGVAGGGGPGDLKSDVGCSHAAAVGNGEGLRSAGHAGLLLRETQAGRIHAEARGRKAGAAQQDGLGPSASASVRVPVRAPVWVGANCTLTLQVECAATPETQLLDC